METLTKSTLWEEKNSTEQRTNFLNNNELEQNDTTTDTKKDSTKNRCLDIGISGIYKIVNKVNSKYYVGSSVNIKGCAGSRWYSHKSELINNKHYNTHLQRAWNKYGKNNFEFIIVEQTSSDKNELKTTEQKYLDVAKKEKDKCYNTNFIADRIEMTDSIKKKISEKMKKYCSSQIIKQNMSDRMKSNKNPRFGKPVSDVTKHLIRTKLTENNKLSKKVKQIDLQSKQTIKIWNSAGQAHYFLTGKKSSGHIGEVCNGKKKFADGYYWEWY